MIFKKTRLVFIDKKEREVVIINVVRVKDEELEKLEKYH